MNFNETGMNFNETGIHPRSMGMDCNRKATPYGSMGMDCDETGIGLFFADKELNRSAAEVPVFADLVFQKAFVRLFDPLG